VPRPLPGLRVGDLFEGRLVPFADELHFSPAFLFHPKDHRARIVREIRKQRRNPEAGPVQEIVWTLARMSTRSEHYRKMSLDTIYDFERPPLKVASTPFRFDRASIDARLGRVLPGETETSTDER